MNDQEITIEQFFSDFCKIAATHTDKSVLELFLENSKSYAKEAAKASLPWLAEGFKGKFKPVDKISHYKERIDLFISKQLEQ